jgi:hypothetical protein
MTPYMCVRQTDFVGISQVALVTETTTVTVVQGQRYKLWQMRKRH